MNERGLYFQSDFVSRQYRLHGCWFADHQSSVFKQQALRKVLGECHFAEKMVSFYR